MSSKERKPYRKPEVTRVRLVPKEAVLFVCKTASSGGGQNTSGNCVTQGSPAACVDQTGS